jgi:hypothetical protein
LDYKNFPADKDGIVKLMENVLESKTDEQLNEILESLDKTIKSVSKLKLSGIILKLHFNFDIGEKEFAVEVVNIKPVNNEEYTLNCGMINNGNMIIVPYLLRSAGFKVNIIDLKLNIQYKDMIYEICAVMAEPVMLDKMYSFVKSGKEKLVYNEDTIDKLAVILNEMIDEEMKEDWEDEIDSMYIINAMNNLLKVRVGYECTGKIRVDMSIYNAIVAIEQSLNTMSELDISIKDLGSSHWVNIVNLLKKLIKHKVKENIPPDKVIVSDECSEMISELKARAINMSTQLHFYSKRPEYT